MCGETEGGWEMWDGGAVNLGWYYQLVWHCSRDFLTPAKAVLLHTTKILSLPPVLCLYGIP